MCGYSDKKSFVMDTAILHWSNCDVLIKFVHCRCCLITNGILVGFSFVLRYVFTNNTKLSICSIFYVFYKAEGIYFRAAKFGFTSVSYTTPDSRCIKLACSRFIMCSLTCTRTQFRNFQHINLIPAHVSNARGIFLLQREILD